MNEKKNLYKFPITQFEKHMNKMGNGYVPCMVSDRWIQFPKKSVGHFGAGEFISIDVMTHSYKKEEPVKLCELIVTREHLEKALNAVKQPDSETK